MKSSISIFSLLIVFLLGSSFSATESFIGSWKKLGTKKVSYKLDKDVIHVGPNDGTYKKLKIAVTGGSVNIHKIVVEYGNGSKDKISVKHNFCKGSSSRLLDLEGGNRIIKDITFWYDTKNSSKKRAKVHVFGAR